MDRHMQLHFKLLTTDAQRSAIRRLALSGLDDAEIAERTGWAVTDIRRILAPAMTPAIMPAVMQKMRRSGSSGGRS